MSGLYKDLPHNLEAEQAVLGALMVKNDLMPDIVEIVKPPHFFSAANVKIYETIAELAGHGRIASPVTLKTALGQHLEACGGVSYLIGLAQQAVTASSAIEYARVIKDNHVRRALIEIAEVIVHGAKSVEGAEETVRKAEYAIHELLIGNKNETVVRLSDWVRRCLESLGDRRGTVDSGLPSLDKIINGFSPSDLIILAARPGMGKSAAAANIAWRAAKNGKRVLFFSLEMSGEQLASRILADEYSINAFDFRTKKPEINGPECMKHVEQFGFYIDDTPSAEIGIIRQRVRREKAKEGVDLVVVDYLQLLQPSRKRENRVQEVSDVTQNLKAIAKECHVPVVALSQLSRAVEAREGNRPSLSDLRESGSQEQDADIVIFIFREAYYLEKQRPVWRQGEDHADFEARVANWESRMAMVRDKAEFIVAKHRHGPTGIAEARFEAEFSRFIDC